MSDAAGDSQQSASEAIPAAPSPVAHPTSAAPQRGRMLLPYYLANLAAIYLPSLLPQALEVHRRLDEEIGVDVRTIAVDALAAPWAGLRFVLERGVFHFAEYLGNAGSLYAFLLTLWLVTLLASMLYCNDKRRYALTFVLFVLSTVQAIFVAERFIAENQQPEPKPAAVDPKF